MSVRAPTLLRPWEWFMVDESAESQESSGRHRTVGPGIAPSLGGMNGHSVTYRVVVQALAAVLLIVVGGILSFLATALFAHIGEDGHAVMNERVSRIESTHSERLRATEKTIREHKARAEVEWKEINRKLDKLLQDE